MRMGGLSRERDDKAAGLYWRAANNDQRCDMFRRFAGALDNRASCDDKRADSASPRPHQAGRLATAMSASVAMR
jgi:hypothetical protein